jgi:hypothetical protein
MARQHDSSGWYCVSETGNEESGGIPVYSRHAPGRRYCRYCWPPRGRGEDRYSPRRIVAIQKAVEALRLRAAGLSYERTAVRLGYRDRSGA